MAEVMQKLLIFEVSAVRYAVDIKAVREVLRPFAFTPLPSSKPYVVGALEHRGEVLPVLDLRLRMGLAAHRDGAGRDERFIIVQHQGLATAVWVDCVREVWSVEPARRREVPEPLEPSTRGSVAAYSLPGGLVFVLDAKALGSDEPVSSAADGLGKAPPEVR